MPAVSPRARVRLRAVAVAFTVSSSLVVGIASAPAQASTTTTTSTAPVTSTGTTLQSAASALSLTAYESVLAKTTVKKPAPKKAVHKVVKKPVSKKPAAKHKVVKHKVVKHKATKKKVVKKKAPKLAFGIRVVRDASVYKGTPYEYGASGPARFDCSGFTRYIFAKFGISLPHSSSAQYSMVKHISSNDKQIGDLIFFHTSGGHVYHVGIYAGNDEIWAATHTGDFVRLEGMWNASYYVGRIS